MNDEARLESLAKRLGASAAERLDAKATARIVVERLREPPVRRTMWVQQTWLRIAAAVLLVVGGAAVASRLPTGSGFETGLTATHGAHFVADDLSDLSTDQLRDVLTAFDEIVDSDNVAVPDGSSDLRQLDQQQLRAVLRSLEG